MDGSTHLPKQKCAKRVSLVISGASARDAKLDLSTSPKAPCTSGQDVKGSGHKSVRDELRGEPAFLSLTHIGTFVADLLLR